MWFSYNRGRSSGGADSAMIALANDMMRRCTSSERSSVGKSMARSGNFDAACEHNMACGGDFESACDDREALVKIVAQVGRLHRDPVGYPRLASTLVPNPFLDLPLESCIRLPIGAFRGASEHLDEFLLVFGDDFTEYFSNHLLFALPILLDGQAE
jgi:hypothetical protein